MANLEGQISGQSFMSGDNTNNFLSPEFIDKVSENASIVKQKTNNITNQLSNEQINIETLDFSQVQQQAQTAVDNQISNNVNKQISVDLNNIAKQNKRISEIKQLIAKIRPGRSFRFNEHDKTCHIDFINNGSVRIYHDDGFSYDFTVTPDNVIIDNITKMQHSLDSTPPINAQDTLLSVSRLTGAGFLTADLIKMITESKGTALIEFSGEIISKALSSLSERAGMLATSYVAQLIKMTTTIPTDITDNAKKRFEWTKEDAVANNNENAPIKKTLGDVMAQLGTPLEKSTEESEIKETESKIKSFIAKTKTNSAKIINDVNKYVDEYSKKFQEIMIYASNGLEYIETEINNAMDDALENLDAELRKKFTDAKREINEFTERIGNQQGETLVKTYNNALDKSAKKLSYIQNKAITKNKIKASQAVQTAKLKIMSKIDIELPM